MCSIIKEKVLGSQYVPKAGLELTCSGNRWSTKDSEFTARGKAMDFMSTNSIARKGKKKLL